MAKHRLSIAALVVAISGLTMGGAHSYSEAANYVAQEQTEIGCNGQAGVFTKLWETDITGDGKKDLILDHARLTCANGSGSSNCGASGLCEILVFVRKGGLLVETALPENTHSVDKLSGARLKLLIGPQLKSRVKIVRWNGTRFK